MSRNITILVIILVVILIAGYLLWLRGRFQNVQPATVAVPPTVTATPSPTIVASPSAVATPSGKKLSPTPTTRTSTGSGRSVF